MACLDVLASDSKRVLLLFIKRSGDVSLDDAVEATSLARTTIREHLVQLERDGLVERRTKRQGPGRPSLRYRLTELGGSLFPSRDGLLLGQLLGYLAENERDDLIEEFFTSYWESRHREVVRRLDGIRPEDVEGRLAALREILEEQGFMPEILHGSGGIEIRECNCPFPEAVKRTRLPCRLEAQFFERLFDTCLERVSYIPEGQPACIYELAPSECDRAA